MKMLEINQIQAIDRLPLGGNLPEEDKAETTEEFIVGVIPIAIDRLTGQLFAEKAQSNSTQTVDQSIRSNAPKPVWNATTLTQEKWVTE